MVGEKTRTGDAVVPRERRGTKVLRISNPMGMPTKVKCLPRGWFLPSLVSFSYSYATLRLLAFAFPSLGYLETSSFSPPFFLRLFRLCFRVRKRSGTKSFPVLLQSALPP
jgi:hypothetical protein